MIMTDADQLREALAIALRERDEARAEVERLKARYEMLGRLAYADVEVAEAKAREAYQRGAEAMREAAARMAYAQLAHTLTDVHEKIRALPIPEEKP